MNTLEEEKKIKKEAFSKMLKSESGRATWSVTKHLEYVSNNNKIDELEDEKHKE